MCTDSIICVPSKCISNSVFRYIVHRSRVCFQVLYIWTAAPYATSSSGGLPRNSQHFPCNKYLQNICNKYLPEIWFHSKILHKVFEETQKWTPRTCGCRYRTDSLHHSWCLFCCDVSSLSQTSTRISLFDAAYQNRTYEEVSLYLSGVTRQEQYLPPMDHRGFQRWWLQEVQHAL